MAQNQQQKDRVFAEGLFYKVVVGKFGPIGKLSFQVERFVEFLKAHTNDRGYVNIDILEKREPDEKSTHYAQLDDWQRSEKDERPRGQHSPQSPPRRQAVPAGSKAQRPQQRQPVPAAGEGDPFGADAGSGW